MTSTSNNPFYADDALPRFADITPAHAKEAVPELLEEAKRAFAEFEASVEPTWAGIFDRLRMLTEPLERAWHVTSHLMGVRNSDELREVYETLQPQMVQFFSTIGQSEATYRALKALRDSEAWADLSATQKRMVEKEELGMDCSMCWSLSLPWVV